MWAILQGNPATEIAHFERIGLNGLSLNFLTLTREQAFRGREGNSLLVYANYTLAHSLFFLSGALFLSKFPVFPLIFFYFFFFFFKSLISSVLFCFPPSSCSPYRAQLRPFLYCLSWWVIIVLPLNCFCPGIGVLPRPPTGLSVAQPSLLTCAGRAPIPRQNSFILFSYSSWHSHPDRVGILSY